MINAQKIMVKIDSALKEFGTYTYHDKGAHEVMDIDEIVNDLKALSVPEIIATLSTVAEDHPDAGPFLTDCLQAFDTWDHHDADQLFESELFQKWY